MSRVSKAITMPDVSEITEANSFERLKNVLRRLRTAIVTRDARLAEAINHSTVEIVDSAPSDPPDYPEPMIQIYNNGGTWELHVYTGETDGWQKATLS